MEIKDLKYSLSDLKFEYILFDACYMSSIEVLYEMRNNSRYILASPSEVISYGFPYEKIANRLFGNISDLKIICNEYVNFYESLEYKYQSANVALIDLSKLSELVIDLKNLFNDNKTFKINIDEVQTLVFDENVDYEAYDILSLIKTTKNNINKTNTQLNEYVLYKRYTPTFNGKKINDFCGISIYYPYKNRNNIIYNMDYKTYSFYDHSNVSQFFGKF